VHQLIADSHKNIQRGFKHKTGKKGQGRKEKASNLPTIIQAFSHPMTIGKAY
jgi:hypothetical protein